MEGDIADLPCIVKLTKANGARVTVNNARAVGVLGKGGRGLAEHFALEDQVDLIMGTYGKSSAAIGVCRQFKGGDRFYQTCICMCVWDVR